MGVADGWSSWTDEDVWTLTEDEDGPSEDDRDWWSEQTRDDNQDQDVDDQGEAAMWQDSYENGFNHS